MINDYLYVQLKTLSLSLLGIVAIIPGPNNKRKRKIKGVLGNIITYIGIGFLLIPWLVIPFLRQPRFVEIPRIIMLLFGILSILAGITLYYFSLKYLLPAFKKEFSEFTPDTLVIQGPYKYIRNPIYLAAFIIILGIYLSMGASLSILFLPFFYMLLKGIILYEEKMILEPKFKTDFINYKNKVPTSIMGLREKLIVGSLWLVLIGITIAHHSKVVIFDYIK